MAPLSKAKADESKPPAMVRAPVDGRFFVPAGPSRPVHGSLPPASLLTASLLAASLLAASLLTASPLAASLPAALTPRSRFRRFAGGSNAIVA